MIRADPGGSVSLSSMRVARSALVVVTGMLALGGCNAIFGVTSGQGAGGQGGATGGGGAGGAGTCPPAKDATCDPMYVDDGSNCCTKGRDCGDGECVDQECTAAMIVDGKILDHNGDCISITVAGDQLFWTTGGDSSIYRTDIDGEGKVMFDVPGSVPQGATTRIAADIEASPALVYFTDYYGRTVGRLPVDGGDIEAFATVPDVGNQARYGNILVHGDFVYWAMQRENLDANAGKDIWRAKRQPAGVAEIPAELVIANDRPLGLAADEAFLYFGNSQSNTIERIPWSALDEGAALPATSETLATNAAQTAGGDIGEMAVDDEFVYWGSEQTVWAMPKGTPGAQRTAIGPAPSWIGILLADGRDVYYSTLGGTGTPSEVYRAPKGGVGPFPKKLFQTGLLPTNEAIQISSMAEDCDSVYVLARSECDVYRFTK